MAAQKGFIYEQNAAKALKPMGFVPKNFTPAGAGHDQPDLMLLYNGKEAGCELKITAASAGSLVLKYNKSSGDWSFGDIKADEKEKQFIADIAHEVKLFNRINKEWKGVPSKYAPKDADWKAMFGNMAPKERYQRDLNIFRDIKGEIPATKIEQYYNKKATYYVNVGTHGFYLMGSRNPYKLKGVPKFGSSATATYRARVQYKGSGNHQFTFELQFSMKSKSPYNIAPVTSKTNVAINKNAMDLSCFI